MFDPAKPPHERGVARGLLAQYRDLGAAHRQIRLDLAPEERTQRRVSHERQHPVRRREPLVQGNVDMGVERRHGART